MKAIPNNNIAKYYFLAIIIPLLLNTSFSGLFAQDWTPPVNISAINDVCHMPDLCVDSSGCIHSVFVRKEKPFDWRKIYYAKSEDNGLTWSVPEDVSNNTDTTAYIPHIVAGSNGTLHLTYDYNLAPGHTEVHYQFFDGTRWSTPINITPTQPGAHGNYPVLDNNNRLYVFWYWGGKSYYKYLESGIWSVNHVLYPDAYHWLFTAAVADRNNNLHCVGGYLYEGETITDIKFIYFTYNAEEDIWSDKTFLSGNDYIGDVDNQDIDLDTSDYPHVVWHQNTNNSNPFDDSTMYRYFNGSFWPEAELVVNDPLEQRIVIDGYNKPHIVDREKLGTGTMVVSYQKVNGLWQGLIVDSSDINVVAMPELVYWNNSLYLTYYKCFSNEDCRVYFTSKQVTTSLQENNWLSFLSIYPNPFNVRTTINFELNKVDNVILNIYNMKGQLIKTILNKKLPSGRHSIIWNGTDQNGKEVSPGMYLIRLIRGRHVITRAVNYNP